MTEKTIPSSVPFEYYVNHYNKAYPSPRNLPDWQILPIRNGKIVHWPWFYSYGFTAFIRILEMPRAIEHNYALKILNEQFEHQNWCLAVDDTVWFSEAKYQTAAVLLLSGKVRIGTSTQLFHFQTRGKPHEAKKF